jgi:hypothetical protein
MENLAAPNEQQEQHGEWSHSNERDVSKRTYQRVAPVEYLRRRGLLEPEHVQAANKYEKHYRGALGHDTRDSDTVTSDPDVECYQTYCAQMISAAADELGPIQFHALRRLIIEEEPITAIGYYAQADAGVKIRSGRDTCQRYGMAMIVDSLGHLADHWGLLQKSVTSRDRAA